MCAISAISCAAPRSEGAAAVRARAARRTLFSPLAAAGARRRSPLFLPPLSSGPPSPRPHPPPGLSSGPKHRPPRRLGRGGPAWPPSSRGKERAAARRGEGIESTHTHGRGLTRSGTAVMRDGGVEAMCGGCTRVRVRVPRLCAWGRALRDETKMNLLSLSLSLPAHSTFRPSPPSHNSTQHPQSHNPP